MYKKLFITIFFLLYSNSAIALIEVDITRGNLNPLPIAVSPLSIDDESKNEFEKLLKKRFRFRNINNCRKKFKKYWFI